MLELRSWEKSQYGDGDASVCFEVKRLNRQQALEHQRVMANALQAEVAKIQASDIDPSTDAKEGETEGAALVRGLHAKATMEVAALDFYEAIGAEYIRKCFGEYTRDWCGITLDGNPVTTGADIVGYADNALVRHVLLEITRASRLSVKEGNASSSPSGSAPGAGTVTAVSGSDATSTGSAVGSAA